MDFSFRSSIARSNAWSVFSGLSLGDISIMSVVALPVYPDDISNPQHYDFGNDSQSQQTQPQALPQAQGRNERTIFQTLFELKMQLMQIDGFSELFEAESKDNEWFDPLNELRAVFQRGFPLLLVFNELEHRWDVHAFAGFGKQAAAEFIQACNQSLQLDTSDIFTVSELMGSKVSDFLKVGIRSPLVHRLQ